MGQPRGTDSDVGTGVVRTALLAVLLGYCAQQMLTPVLPPLTRELGLTELDLGLAITVAAAALALTSAWWGRAIDRIGARAVLVRGLAVATLGLAGFAVVCALADPLDLSRGALLPAMLATRGLIFGIGLAALPVAAMAYAAAASETAEERTKLMGQVGAAQGGSMVLGPALGGGLALVALLLPVTAAPVLMAAVLVLVLLRVPAVSAVTDPDQPTSGLRATDRRVLPFLLVGFLLFLGLGMVQPILGFLYQDRLGLDGRATAASVGAAGFAIGVVLILTQVVLVPRLGWSPVRLLRTGAVLGAVGYVGTLFAGSFWTLTGGLLLVAIGIGCGLPGFTAGASLSVDRRDQGRVAGLVAAATGSAFVVGPLAGTALYALDDRLPMLASVLLSAAMLAVTLAFAVMRGGSGTVGA